MRGFKTFIQMLMKIYEADIKSGRMGGWKPAEHRLTQKSDGEESFTEESEGKRQFSTL